ncbi:helix-turn-helix domain-containing protein [Kitasatospora kifunensis]|uniref:AraC-like DNA-binding protein n=1 Tax=Kitasatospora kifunensis TaxID=58351 RepID=A0A7W7R9Y6_KITKI|nr:helix-turn-helix domain-containing protein [Kitasatospora kifunensis]MBB4927965.1 AraC-like DNA-binding protein [Kitasatospora kifunensis]
MYTSTETEPTDRAQPQAQTQARSLAVTIRPADARRRPAAPGQRTVTVLLPDQGAVTIGGAQLTPGRLLIHDTADLSPFTMADGSVLTTFAIPRQVLPLTDRTLSAATGRALDTRSGVAALLTAFLRAGASNPAGPLACDRAAGHLIDLLTTLVIELSHQTTTPAAAPTDRTLLADIQWQINLHLGDPSLCPEAIAARHHISVRYLHKVFERENTTVSRWIRQRRLQECCRELSRTGHQSAKISSIAQRWGFANAAHFSRTFRAAYGLSPRAWRELLAAVAAPPAGGELPHGVRHP